MTPARVASSLVALALAAALGACAAPPSQGAPPAGDAAAVAAPPTAAPPTSADDVVARIVAASLAQDRAYERLAHLCDVIGHRLSGSEALERAVAWTAEQMAADGLDVRREPVLVPRWIRGRESLAATAPVARDLVALGLGNSIGTSDAPGGAIEAEVVVARDFDALEAMGREGVAGKIVLFARRMPAYDPGRGAGYGEAAVYRTQGPSRAAKLGAVAALVRSVTATSLRTPHTGMLAYAVEAPRIPAMAVATEDAEWIERRAARGETVRVRLAMEARFEPDVPSANVVGELRGSERPEEIVLVGAHLDSWDVGDGAHDDGANCIAVMEAMAVLRRLGLRPRRTIRAVLYTNEENGLRGAFAYAARHRDEIPMHVCAIEADGGCFRPLGFTSPAPADDRGRRFRERMREVLAPLAALGADRLRDGGGGADIGVLAPGGVPQLGLDVEGSRYFDVHHTAADTFDKVSKEDLDRVVAVLAATAYAIADRPDRIDR